MLKKMIILLSILELFTACGKTKETSPSPSEMMHSKQGIIIFYHYPRKICESDKFYKTMQNNKGFKEVLVQLGNNSIRCADYNKDYPACAEADAEQNSSLSCIVGFNHDSTDNTNNKVNDFETKINDFIDSAIMLIYSN